MNAPVFSVTTERIYGKLPDIYREVDAQNGYEFKKYLASMADQLGEVDLMVERLRYRSQIELEFRNRYAQRHTVYTHPDRLPNAPVLGSTSDLVDPRSADRAWLSWLGQLVGVRVDVNTPDLEARDQIQYASSGYRAGSKDALEKAARSVLSGSRYAKALPHTKVVDGNLVPGSHWDVTILTRGSESPDSVVVLNAVNRPTLKPAGVQLYHRIYTASWDAIEAALPYWKDWETIVWDELEQIGVSYRNIPGNLLTNPSFETDLSTWYVSSGPMTITRQGGGVDGLGQLRAEFTAAGNKFLRTTSFPLTDGRAYTVGLTYKSTVALRLRVVANGTDQFMLELPASGTTWKRANTGFILQGGTGTGYLQVSTTQGDVNDNFTLDGAVVRDATS